MVDSSATKSSDSQSQGGRTKRVKAWTPKVKTGCRTCKRRKVKCDETRPQCERCTKARLECEGYETPPKAWLFESKRPVPLQPQIRSTEKSIGDSSQAHYAFSSTSSVSDTAISSPSAGSFCPKCGGIESKCECADDVSNIHDIPSTESVIEYSMQTQMFGPYRNQQDQQFFKYFVEVAGPFTARSGLSASFWLSAMPQAAWSQPAVRDALLSVSTGFDNIARVVRGKEPRLEGDRLALGYQTKALHGVVERTPSIEYVLLISMGLWMSTMLDGDYRKAMQHSYYALKIVNSVQDRSKHDQAIFIYVENISKAALEFFRTTRGPCMVHPGGSILDCHLSCYMLEEQPLAIRVADTLHHLRQMIPALVACEVALDARVETHSMDRSLRELIQKATRESSFLITCWSDPARLDLKPEELIEAAAVTPYTSSPFPAVLEDFVDLIQKDRDSKVSFQEVELRLRVLMPHITISTARRNRKLLADACTMLFFSTFLNGRLQVMQPWRKQIEMRMGG